MSLSDTVRQQVRKRARYACEYCGVTDADAGGVQTIDHYHPTSKGGTDALSNLVYCCTRCNLYKKDYWPPTSKALHLWNPRTESFAGHFLELDDATLLPLTEVGTFTLQRLRLNRPALVAHRQRKQEQNEQERMLLRYRDLTALYEQLLFQQQALVAEQQELLREQQMMLQWLLARLD